MFETRQSSSTGGFSCSESSFDEPEREGLLRLTKLVEHLFRVPIAYMALLKADYSSQAEARAKIPLALEAFYRSGNPTVLATKADLVKRAGGELATIYSQNVFPEMKVTWGTHPNHIGHMSYPGCFRCHDGDHNARDGAAITQDCAACHNLLAVDEVKPKVLSDLGIQ